MVEICTKHNFDGDAKFLFKLMLDNPGKTVIHMADLDPAAMQAYYRGDLEALSPTEKAKKARVLKEQEVQAEKDMRMGASDWKTLKRELIRQYGSITGAWRNGLDFSG